MDYFLIDIYYWKRRIYFKLHFDCNLLKKEFVSNDDLFIWDVTLSEHGSYIIEKRIAFIEELNSGINETYGQISKTKDIITIHYSNTYIGNIKQKLLNDLNNNLEKDKYLGYTTTGPHRHDVIFQFNNSPALDVASRGEIRSIILALKFLEVNIIEKITEQKPIILLDDVFSELDAKRQSYLIDKKDYQVIITSTHVSDINIKSEYLEIKI